MMKSLVVNMLKSTVAGQ